MMKDRPTYFFKRDFSSSYERAAAGGGGGKSEMFSEEKKRKTETSRSSDCRVTSQVSPSQRPRPTTRESPPWRRRRRVLMMLLYNNNNNTSQSNWFQVFLSYIFMYVRIVYTCCQEKSAHTHKRKKSTFW